MTSAPTHPTASDIGAAVIHAISTGSPTDWRISLDDTDVTQASIDELMELLRTAPSPMAAAFIAGTIAARGIGTGNALDQAH